MKKLFKKWWFYVIAIGAIAGIFAGSSKEDENTVPTQFYKQAIKVEQSGKNIDFTFALGDGYKKIRSNGKLIVHLKWWGQGVASGRTAYLKKSITKDMFEQNCTMYCKATVSFTAPKAHIGPAWISWSASFKPDNGSKFSSGPKPVGGLSDKDKTMIVK